MTRVLIAVVILAVALTVFALVDLGFADRRVRALPKPLWAVLVLVLPLVGAGLWFGIGRPRAARPSAPRGPDDDPAFLRGAGARRPASAKDEETLRRLEDELRGLDADSEDDGEGRRR